MSEQELLIEQICAECKNYFKTGIKSGEFSVIDGTISLPDFIQNGQYFRIVGSVFNDGVYKYPASELKDETFNGTIWAMSVPPAVIALADEVKTFNESDQGTASPYTSESFGGYSYSKATDSNGLPVTWKAVFANKLNRWRKI